MSISIEQKKFNAAFNLAEQRSYFRAAAIFARMDGYEAALNYVGCLAAMGEAIASANAFNKLYVRYHDEYNCVDDLGKLVPVAENIVRIFRNRMQTSGKKVYGDSTKKNADPRLVYEYDFWSDDCDDLGLEFDFYNDSAVWDNPVYAENGIFDVHSKVYRDHLRFTCEKAFLDNDDKKFKAYAKRILDLTDADDVETVEAQVLLCYYLEKYGKATGYLKKLVEFGEQVSSRALRVGLTCLFERGASSNRKTLRTLMEMSLPLLDEFTPTDLCDMIYYATRCVENGKELAYKFALKLFPLADDSWACTDLLRVCACAFYNSRDEERARQAALKILEIVPDDVFAKAMVQFVNIKLDNAYQAEMNIAPYDERSYALPEPLVILQKYILMTAMQEKKHKMGDDELEAICALLSASKVCVLGEMSEKIADMFTVACVALQYGEFDKQAFVDKLLKPVMSQVDLPLFIVEPLLNKAISLGCTDKVFVASDRYYWVDLSLVTITDQRFVDALSVCASFGYVDIVAMEQAFKDLLEKSGGLDESVTQMQIVYFLMRKTIKGFASSSTAEHFDKADREALKKYL